jgi:hypothetical protein
MQVLLVRSFLAFVFAPLMVFFCMRVIVKYAAARGPRYWWAVGAAMYAVIVMILGMSQGAGAGGELGAMLAFSERGAWLASMAGGAISVALSFWVIVVQYARLRAMLPPPEPGQ